MANPTPESVQDAQDGIIEQVKANFIDLVEGLYSNMEEGPFIGNLSETFTDERWSLFITNTIDDVNIRLATSGIAFTEESYPYDLPLGSSVLRAGMIVHAIKHFKISFAEYPDWNKVSSPTIDRRDYLNRWDTVLRDWEDRFKKGLEALAAQATFDMLGGSTQVLVDPASMNWGVPARRYGGIVPPWWYGY